MENVLLLISTPDPASGRAARGKQNDIDIGWKCVNESHKDRTLRIDNLPLVSTGRRSDSKSYAARSVNILISSLS